MHRGVEVTILELLQRYISTNTGTPASDGTGHHATARDVQEELPTNVLIQYMGLDSLSMVVLRECIRERWHVQLSLEILLAKGEHCYVACCMVPETHVTAITIDLTAETLANIISQERQKSLVSVIAPAAAVVRNDTSSLAAELFREIPPSEVVQPEIPPEIQANFSKQLSPGCVVTRSCLVLHDTGRQKNLYTAIYWPQLSAASQLQLYELYSFFFFLFSTCTHSALQY